MCPNVTYVSPSNANITTLQLRDEDSFDQRQSLLAADVSRSWESASQKRIDHNDNYIAHWPREKRSGHKEAVTYAQKKSVKYGREVQKHRDVRIMAPFWGSFDSVL